MELLLELFLHVFTGGSAGGHLFFSHDVLEIQVILEDESGGHHVVVVDELGKGLQAALSIEFLLAHLAGDLAGRSLNANNESVGEFSTLHSKSKRSVTGAETRAFRHGATTYLLSIVVLFNNDCLLTGLSA